MTADKQLHLALRQLSADIKNLQPDEAIQKIDDAIASSLASYEPHYLVKKANMLWFAARQTDAMSVLTDCCDRFSAEPSASFFLGQYLLELTQYQKAKIYLTQCIDASKLVEDTWYLDSAYLLHAYAAAKTGDKKTAVQSLAYIADDEPMDWIDVDPPVSKDSIKAMLG
jgi:tetratricopeptide (TPR) repeat protein